MKRSEILNLRRIIETAVQSLTDELALQSIVLHPIWSENDTYLVGHKVQHDDKLWRCIQAHTSIVGWEPDVAPSLWEQINETHSGTITDPIPYSGNMVLVSGMYYIQDAVTYRCIRDTVNPVYNNLSELVGVYVELV